MADRESKWHNVWLVLSFVGLSCVLLPWATLEWTKAVRRAEAAEAQLAAAESSTDRPVFGAAASSVAPMALYRATLRSLHDGDTAHFDIALGWGVVLADRPVRALGYDAPELTRARRSVGEITDAELAAGKAARDALAKLLTDARAIFLRPGPEPFDPYGRVLAGWLVEPKAGGDLVDVASWMKARGFDRGGAD